MKNSSIAKCFHDAIGQFQSIDVVTIRQWRWVRVCCGRRRRCSHHSKNITHEQVCEKEKRRSESEIIDVKFFSLCLLCSDSLKLKQEWKWKELMRMMIRWKSSTMANHARSALRTTRTKNDRNAHWSIDFLLEKTNEVVICSSLEEERIEVRRTILLVWTWIEWRHFEISSIFNRSDGKIWSGELFRWIPFQRRHSTTCFSFLS